jgi:hypothetical protein
MSFQLSPAPRRERSRSTIALCSQISLSPWLSILFSKLTLLSEA